METLWYYNKALKNTAGWSSLVARRAHNPKVVGSNPAPATTKTGRSLDLSVFFPKKYKMPGPGERSESRS